MKTFDYRGKDQNIDATPTSVPEAATLLIAECPRLHTICPKHVRFHASDRLAHRYHYPKAKPHPSLWVLGYLHAMTSTFQEIC